MNRFTLQQRYNALEGLLQRTRVFWEPAPFHIPEPEWTRQHPALYNAIIALPDEKVEYLEHNISALCEWLQPSIPDLASLPSLVDLPTITPRPPTPWPTGFEWDMPGRKWAQVEAFSRSIAPQAEKFIDWCAGKGHLSRSVAFQHQRPVVALEWNAALCEAAHQYNQEPRYRTSQVTPILQDVMDASAQQHITENCHCIALHACGKLHLQLMHAATRQHAPALSFSPCCYHLIDAAVYTPLADLHSLSEISYNDTPQIDCNLKSKVKTPPRLQLNHNTLRLAMQETVTANGHARRLRTRKSAWRLAFQEWLTQQPEIASLNAPPPSLPSMPDRYYHQGFAYFCEESARRMGVIFPHTDNEAMISKLERLETAGWQAQARVQRLELVRHAFRRALEIWLCLDRACWLQQQGYAVEMATFCETQVTPRNILITAIKKKT